MRLLVIGHPELYENRRLVAEGRRAGLRVDAERMERLTFTVRRGVRRVSVGRRDVLASYDAIYLRHFYPYISEALILAEWAKTAGLAVIDRHLADGVYVNSKMYQNGKLAAAGLPVADGFQSFRTAEARRLLAGSSWPVVAKGVHGSKGRYVFEMKDRRDAERTLSDDLVGFFTFQERLAIDEEYRVLVVGGRALGAMRKFPAAGEFRHNVAAGATGARASLPGALVRACERAARIFRYELAGVDLAIVGGRPVILEVNRAAGFEGFERATGVNAARAFLERVADLVGRRRRRVTIGPVREKAARAH